MMFSYSGITSREQPLKKSVYKNFVKFTEKHLCHKFAGLRPERDSNTGVFCKILQHFQERLFHKTPPGDCF